MDSNGDGIGDLRGITDRLDYIQELGANAVWICPCFKSPNEDNGYDVADYTDIMDEFGTMEDMDELIRELHSRGMKLILDLVPNHTSTMHRWFRESRKGRDNPYSDFYYWVDEVPNDWQSAFGGSAWEYDEMRGQYYLHIFAKGQADLNWDNPAVRKAMQDVIDFWAARGADGFRIDVVDLISKDLENGKWMFGPHLHEYIRDMFGRPETEHLFTVGESNVRDIDELVRHCGPDRGELVSTFVFDHIECGRSDKYTPNDDGLRELRDILVYWQNKTAEHGILYTLFTDNHDQPQLISRIADDKELRYESATCVAAMVYLLRGVPFIYQGQELGMGAPYYDSIEEFDDVESIGAYCSMQGSMSEEEKIRKINFGSRDNARHPMPWDDTENGGFTTGRPWIALNSRRHEINAARDMAAEKSVYRFYQELLRLRRENEAFLDGEFEVLSQPEDNYFIFTRTVYDASGSDQDRWIVVCNFENESDIRLPAECCTPALSNLRREAADGIYAPYECSISKVK